jgi:hypothetical protein
VDFKTKDSRGLYNGEGKDWEIWSSWQTGGKQRVSVASMMQSSHRLGVENAKVMLEGFTRETAAIIFYTIIFSILVGNAGFELH